MKTKIMLFLLLTAGFFFTTTVSAQIKIGPKAGVNLATISNTDDFDTEMLVGFSFGAVAEIGVADNFAIQPELAFTRKGTGIDVPRVDAGFRTNYLDLFVLGKYSFGGESGLGGYIAAGPQFGYFLNGDIFADDEDMEIPEDEINKFEVGVSAGGGVNYVVADGPTIFLDLRYVLGLTSWVEDEDTDSSNRGIGISVGALFNIGGE